MFICVEPLSGNIGHLSVKVCKVAAELCKVFGIIPSQTELAGNLMCLRQGQLSVTHYTNLAAQIDTIMHRLLDYIKDELVSHKVPSSLNDLVELAIYIDL